MDYAVVFPIRRDTDPTNAYAKVNLDQLFLLRDASPDKTWLKEPVAKFRTQLQRNPEVADRVKKQGSIQVGGGRRPLVYTPSVILFKFQRST